MKKDDKTTKVLFLIEQSENGTGSVLAFFPENLFTDRRKDVFECYSHVGQHSSCRIEYANECKQATGEQFTPLLNELLSIGYKLEVLNKPTLKQMAINARKWLWKNGMKGNVTVKLYKSSDVSYFLFSNLFGYSACEVMKKSNVGLEFIAYGHTMCKLKD